MSARGIALALGTAAICACARPSPRPAGAPAAPGATPDTAATETATSWEDARKAARASLDVHDYAAFHRQIEAMYARSRSVWVLVDLARADLLVGDRASALARLDAVARAGMVFHVDEQPAFAALKDDPALAPIRARFAANAQPVAHAKVLFSLPHDELVTEDVAYDRASRTYFVSSVRRRKILALDSEGHARDFIAEGAHGLGSISGLTIVSGRLWATTGALPPMVGFDPKAPSGTALVAFDLRDGSLLARIEPPPDGRAHGLTDLAASSDGTLFVSDSVDATLYVLAPGATALEPIASRAELVSPQTAAPSRDGRTVFLPDYVRGIAAIDRQSHRLSWLGHADDVALLGIDGLYLDDDGTFVAVQNGVEPPRVVRLHPSADGARIERVDVLERATPGFAEPTHGTFVDGAFVFLANAGWTRFDDHGKVAPDAPPDAPALWSLPREGHAPRAK